MSISEEQAALVRVQTATLAQSGVNALAARGHADLRAVEAAEECLKKGAELYGQNQYADALACLERGIELNPNHPEIQFLLGLSFDEGLARSRDNEVARAWYLKAAEQGLKDAQYNLGLLYCACDDGPGLLQNYDQAAKWFRKAAEHGDERAQSRLRLLICDGLTSPLDEMEAAFLHRKETGHRVVEAQLIAGIGEECQKEGDDSRVGSFEELLQLDPETVLEIKFFLPS